jgi:Fe-S oxidoreductase
MAARPTFELLPAWTPAALYGAFALCVVAGVVLLRRRLRGVPVVSLIRAAWRTPGWRSGAPLWRLLRIALLQRRVVQRRRGWLHVALTAGFAGLTFATLLVALDWDLLRPLHRRLLEGDFENWFEAGADLFGLLFAAGIVAFLVRNVVARSAVRADEPAARRRRGRIALLTVLLVLATGGFLLEGLRLELRPAPSAPWSFAGARVASLLHGRLQPATAASLYVALWWSHALVALGLLALLPATSLLHALAAPLTILVSEEHPAAELPTPFDLRELIARGEFDLKAGSSRLADLDGRARLALLACTGCGRCDEVCPSHRSGGPLAPSRLIASLRERHDAEDRDGDLLDGTLSDAALFACTTCAACVESCPVLVRPADLVVPFRRELVSRRRVDRGHSELLAALGRSSNPYGLPNSQRAAFARSLGFAPPARDRPQQWLYWVGCAAAFDARIGRVVAATLQVLRSGGLEVAALGEEERCTGDAARRLGEEGLFQQLALENLATLGRHGVTRIVTHCAHCLHALKNEYPRFGGRFEVVHHSELIARLVRTGRLRLAGAGAGRVTFHDPCYLGRYDREFDAPRAALAAVPGLEPVEMERSGAASFCCGGGGAGYWHDAGSRDTPAAIRLREAAATGARTVAVGCPFCLKMLQGAATASSASPTVADVAEIVAAALERPA